jgi:hypothetical protein
VVLVHGQGGLALDPGGVVVAKPGGAPAHRVQCACFPCWLTESTEEVQRTGGVVQRPFDVSLLLARPSELEMGVCLFGEVVVVFREGECLVKAFECLVVLAQIGTDTAEEPVGANAGRGVR